MRRFIMRGVMLALVTGACLAGQARAQNREKAWEVSPFLGYVRFGDPNLGDDVTIENNPVAMERTVTVIESDIDHTVSYGFRFAYHLTKAQMIDFGFGGSATTGHLTRTETIIDTMTGQTTSTQVNGEDLSIDLITAQTNYTYNFFLHHRDKVVAYATGGVGIVNISIFGQTAVAELVPVLDELVGDENDLLLNYGGGLRLFGGKKAGVRFDLRRFQYSSSRRGSLNHLEFFMGMTLILGGA
jgi:hypothetical protein